MDLSLPISFDIDVASAGLGEAMQLFSGFQPIVSISTKDIWGPSSPSFAIDFDIEVLLNNTESIIGNLLSELTGGLGIVASEQGSSSSFDAGPLGNIEGILAKFDLNFSDLLTELKGFYDDFKADILAGDSDFLELYDLKPFKGFSQFPALLQLGSKTSSDQFSPDLKGILWDRLSMEFASPNYNGVRVPSLPHGLSFTDAYPNRGDFPGTYGK